VTGRGRAGPGRAGTSRAELVRPTLIDPVRTNLPAGHVWLRVADASWDDPLDPTWAMRLGGRWNPPGSFPVLYLNEDLETARAQIAGLLRRSPVNPEDLRDDAPFVLVLAVLPTRQRVADALSDVGVRELGLPVTYPFDRSGRVVERSVCQPIGVAVHDAALRGIWYRSAKIADGTRHELAWFPADDRSRPTTKGAPLSFRRWWGASDLDRIAPRPAQGRPPHL